MRKIPSSLLIAKDRLLPRARTVWWLRSSMYRWNKMGPPG